MRRFFYFKLAVHEPPRGWNEGMVTNTLFLRCQGPNPGTFFNDLTKRAYSFFEGLTVKCQKIAVYLYTSIKDCYLNQTVSQFESYP